MKEYEGIQSIIEQITPDFRTRLTDLTKAVGCILQEDVRADADMPPFHKSAVDGYACNHRDLDRELLIVDRIPAGKQPAVRLGDGECAEIMTGALIPEGADCVFMLEDATVTEDRSVRCTRPGLKCNVLFRGEDYRKGEVLIPRGQILRPDHLAVAAGAGYTQLLVTRVPVAAVIVTGSELVDPGQVPEPGKIRNTNGIQICCLLEKMNIPSSYYGIVRDEMEILRNTWKKAIGESDFILLTGGAAAGKYDLIPGLLEAEGFSPLWSRTGMKPGNPMSYSVRNGKHCFGLSGNPVSSLVQFEFLVKPVLYRILGANYLPLRWRGALTEDFKRKNASRFGVFPVRMNAVGTVELLSFNGSAHLHALTGATALMEVPEGTTHITKGEWVYVRPL